MIELKNTDHFCILVGKLDLSKRYYMQIFNGIFKMHPRDSKTLMFESEMVHFFLKEVGLPQNLVRKSLKNSGVSHRSENHFFSSAV